MRTFSREKLAAALNDRRVNLSGIAEITGISRVHLSVLKKGNTVPEPDTLVLLADVLEKPLDYFFVEKSSCNYIKA